MTPDQIQLRDFLLRVDRDHNHVISAAEMLRAGLQTPPIELHNVRPSRGGLSYTADNDTIVTGADYRASLYTRFNLLPRQAQEAITAAGITSFNNVRISDICADTGPNDSTTCHIIGNGNRVEFTDGRRT